MRVFISIPWVDGTDADYYVAESLEEAILFLKIGQFESFLISSEANISGIPESDYTQIVQPEAYTDLLKKNGLMN